MISVGEECDDANTSSGDGCDFKCSIESGYEWTSSPSIWMIVWGNGNRNL